MSCRGSPSEGRWRAASTGGVVDALSAWFGPPSVSNWSENFILVAVTLGTFVAVDFALWATHYLQHRVGCLWELHKVHHSAEVLNPVSAYRVHPLDDWMNLTATGAAMAAFQGFARYLAGYSVDGVSFFGLNVFIFLFYALGFNLRHSHVQLRYPAWLSHLMISPAQHQIHHSSDLAHIDKNFGFALAIWDALAGTLYVPRQREELRFGLHGLAGGSEASLAPRSPSLRCWSCSRRRVRADNPRRWRRRRRSIWNR